MNAHLQKLIELSKNDQAIDSYTPQLEAADKKVAKVQKKIDRENTELQSLTDAIEENEVKIRSFDEQLTMLNEQLTLNAKKAKEITNEKEMQALSLEEDIAKEKMTFANEEIERLQGINVTKQALVEEVNERLSLLNADFASITTEVNAQKAEIEKSKALLFTQREELSRSIEQKVLAFYEKIRIWAGNTAVVPVRKQACYGCYMKLNDKIFSEVIRVDELCNCPHCGRILYIEPITEEA